MTDRMPHREAPPHEDCRFTIRDALLGDLDTIVRLCVAHAEYEGVALAINGQHDRLALALFGQTPRLWCLVAEIDGHVEAYSTYAREYSTWCAAEYLHVDCLYVTPLYRGRGLGQALMARVAGHAASLGTTHLEWQTPAWNAPGVRFYERIGAAGKPKVRFTWHPNQI